MIASTSHQAWLFYFPLVQQAALLKDDLLDPVDRLLDDPALMDLVRQSLATRSPLSHRTGRTGMAPDRLLRCCVIKHLKGWSFRDLERELRNNLVYRRFTHFDAEATPDFTNFSRTFALLSPAVTEEIHQRVVRLACEQGVAQGRKIRPDTTVVESNVHYPTDSSLLGDGIWVLSRSLERIAGECKQGAVEVVHHARVVKHRLLEISRAAKCLTQANQQRMRDSYQKLLALTRSVVRQASNVIERWGKKTTEGGRQAAMGGSADRPATTLSPFGRAGDQPNQATRVGRRQQRGGQRCWVCSKTTPKSFAKGKRISPTSLVGWCGLTRWKTVS
jgi:IS5 family transposase